MSRDPTSGGPGESYRPGGYNRFTMAELMRPIDAAPATALLGGRPDDELRASA